MIKKAFENQMMSVIEEFCTLYNEYIKSTNIGKYLRCFTIEEVNLKNNSFNIQTYVCFVTPVVIENDGVIVGSDTYRNAQYYTYSFNVDKMVDDEYVKSVFEDDESFKYILQDIPKQIEKMRDRIELAASDIKDNVVLKKKDTM